MGSNKGHSVVLLFLMLGVVIKDNIASLSFIPRDQVAGFRSVRTDPSLQHSSSAQFLISAMGDQIWVSNDSILSGQVTVETAKAFFRTKQLPECVMWFEL